MSSTTPLLCAFHDVEVVRRPRGVVSGPLGDKLHSDVNGALNIMKLEVKRTVNVWKNLLPFS
ncbi:transposase [Metallosphaera tengchongensis]|uniref:transposase n=1 Tax=Metallosphaera tengchongensis TaxID=1532350 RepID=UPI001FE3772D|nr:transposase [Metallosphaera tengchongensis]